MVTFGLGRYVQKSWYKIFHERTKRAILLLTFLLLLIKLIFSSICQFPNCFLPNWQIPNSNVVSTNVVVCHFPKISHQFVNYPLPTWQLPNVNHQIVRCRNGSCQIVVLLCLKDAKMSLSLHTLPTYLVLAIFRSFRLSSQPFIVKCISVSFFNTDSLSLIHLLTLPRYKT